MHYKTNYRTYLKILIIWGIGAVPFFYGFHLQEQRNSTIGDVLVFVGLCPMLYSGIIFFYYLLTGSPKLYIAKPGPSKTEDLVEKLTESLLNKLFKRKYKQ